METQIYFLLSDFLKKFSPRLPRIIDISEVLSSAAQFQFLLLTCSVVKMLKLYGMVIISLATDSVVSSVGF